jgi:hypothetical protein
VAELVDRLLANDLTDMSAHQTRHRIALGAHPEGGEVGIEPYGTNLLITGTSGSGKSSLTMGLIERFAAAGYEFCLVDPEGDYGPFAEAIVLGDQHNAPTVEEVMQVTARAGVNVIVNLLAVPLPDRPEFLDALLLRMQELRVRTGRPHWLVIDEAHHMLQPPLAEARAAIAESLENVALITPHPQMVDEHLLRGTGALIVVGEEIAKTIEAFASARGITAPTGVPERLDAGDAYLWLPDAPATNATIVRTHPAQAERRRHERKYAEGELGAERSFYFRGPDGKFNLRAQNLMMFMQIADGLDDETWRFHLGRRDYSAWFRDMIKDEDLARAAERIEAQPDAPVVQSRGRIRREIEARYTLPAAVPTGSSATGPE